MSDAPAVKTGRITPVVRPRLKLGNFVDLRPIAEGRIGTAAPPPESVHRTDWELDVPMLANGPDSTVTKRGAGSKWEIVAQYGTGNCVAKAILNFIRHAEYGAGRVPPAFTGDDGLLLYSAIGGYDPEQTAPDGSNPTDQGLEPNQAFTYWQTHGVPLPGGGVDKIHGIVEVKANSPTEWGIGVAEFDAVLTGLNLPKTILGEPDEWTVVDPALTGESEPGSLGGHEILKVSYDPDRERNYSWAERPLTTRGFLVAYCDQLTVVITEDMVNAKTGKTETGLDWDQLLAAAAALQ